MENQRELFEIKRGRDRLAIAVRTRGRRRTYIGYINGQPRAVAPAKGDLLRALIKMAECSAEERPFSTTSLEPC